MSANKFDPDREHDAHIYLTAFNPCILRCIHANGHPSATLYMEHTLDTLYIQLAFTEKVFTERESLFRCDYMEARDGGLPFLTIVDVLKIGERHLKDTVSQPVRFELVKQILSDPDFFDVHSSVNEFRLRSPELFHVSDIHEVTTFFMPSFYGMALGTAFITDRVGSQRKVVDIGKNTDSEFIIRKTQKPEVYELYIDGVQPVAGNNIAYIPTIDLSKKVKAFLQHRNSARIPCVFHEGRQKWMPVL